MPTFTYVDFYNLSILRFRKAKKLDYVVLNTTSPTQYKISIK